MVKVTFVCCPRTDGRSPGGRYDAIYCTLAADAMQTAYALSGSRTPLYFLSEAHEASMGESDQGFAERMARVEQLLREIEYKSIAVVSHRDLIEHITGVTPHPDEVVVVHLAAPS